MFSGCYMLFDTSKVKNNSVFDKLKSYKEYHLEKITNDTTIVKVY